MGVILSLTALVALALIGLALNTWLACRAIERRFPPMGTLANVNGRAIHYVERSGHPALTPVVFVHGASGNLRDQLAAFEDALAGLPEARRPRTIYVDRPGAGYTERRSGDHDPDEQAQVVVDLLDALEIPRAVVCGHSYGAGVAATFAAVHPERAAGIALLAPASHPWPGRLVWYYRLVGSRLLRHLSAWTFILPVGRRMLDGGVAVTFAPNPVPTGYAEGAGIELLFRPANFLANASDINHIKRYAAKLSPRYAGIACPTYICAGDEDRVVRSTIHAMGLYRAIPHARMDWYEGVGHKPDYVLTDLIVEELVRMAAPPFRVIANPERQVERELTVEPFRAAAE